MNRGPQSILLCMCARSGAIPHAAARDVLAALCRAGANFDVVPDLCELSALGGARLREIAAGESPVIVACAPRAVEALFAAAGARLPDGRVHDLATQPAPRVIDALLGEGEDD